MTATEAAPPGQADGDAEPASVPGWLSSNIKNLLIPVPLLLVALRVVRVGHGSVQAEEELITAGSAVTVVFGALAPVVPYLLFASAAGLAVAGYKKWDAGVDASGEAGRRQAIVLWTLAAVACTLIVSSVPWPMLPYLAAWLVVILLCSCLAYWVIVIRPRTSPRGMKDLIRKNFISVPATVWICAALAFSLLQIGLDDRPWLPAEHLTAGDVSNQKPAPTDVVGYVLKSEGGVLTVMERDRRIVLVPEAALRREVCRIDRHSWWARVEASLSRKSTLLQLVTNEPSPADGDSCPTSKSTVAVLPSKG